MGCGASSRVKVPPGCRGLSSDAVSFMPARQSEEFKRVFHANNGNVLGEKTAGADIGFAGVGSGNDDRHGNGHRFDSSGLNSPAGNNLSHGAGPEWNTNYIGIRKNLHEGSDDEFDVKSVNDAEESRGNSSGALTSGDNEAPNLAVFFSKPQECFYCRTAAVTYECQYCEAFYVCDDCMCNENCVHDPTHPMSAIYELPSCCSRTCSSSVGTIDDGASSLFYDPCDVCGRVINDVELVYHCAECNAVICNGCFQANGGAVHEHEIKPFRRSIRSGTTGSALVNKSRNSEGNKVINDYVVVRLLGRGSYAKVNLVQHHRTLALYALKILRCNRTNKAKRALLGRASSGDDWLREIAVMKFVSHPNIVKLKEVIDDVEANKVYLIMEYCAKGPVHTAGEPPLPLEKVRKYSRDIMAGLLHFHGEYLFHRDIKPANCLVDDNDVVKIADFGASSSQMKNLSTEGTLAYSCPEQLSGERVPGNVVDSWAFALTVYQMAFGFLPIATESLSDLRVNLLNDQPINIPTDADPELRDVLSRMLEKHLSRRMLLQEAAYHPFFRMEGNMVPSPPSRAPGDDVNAGLNDLYARAMDMVTRGRGVEDCFHGVRAIRKLRRKAHTWDVNSMDNEDSNSVDSGNPSPSPIVDTMDACHPYTSEADAFQVVSMLLETLKKGNIKLIGRPLTEFPSFLTDASSTTTEIRLSNNGFSSVGRVSFSQFMLLREVSITNNSLTSFPVEILSAPRLRKLDLSNNRITDVPAEISRATILERLSLHNNRIRYVGMDESGKSVFSGRCMRHVRLSGNPLTHLPEALQTCPRLELVLDDFPVLVAEWSHLLPEVSVVVVWNDICPLRVCPDIPVLTSVKGMHLFSLAILETLSIRHVVLPHFGDWLPIGEVTAEDMEHVSQRVKGDEGELPDKFRRPLQKSLANSTDDRGSTMPRMRFRPPILRRAACRYLYSYFIIGGTHYDENGGYLALLNYLQKCIKRGELVFLCFDEKKVTRAMRERIIGVLCELIQENSPNQLDVNECIQMVINATKGLYG
ncbi:putative Calcium/calmodulin-dependent protein kinase kinase [Trypanosoma cruzi]|nr:putative Calcium/calmodulin-dependent protein kinase kinase [Trypanosoma cruzi]